MHRITPPRKAAAAAGALAHRAPACTLKDSWSGLRGHDAQPEPRDDLLSAVPVQGSGHAEQREQCSHACWVQRRTVILKRAAGGASRRGGPAWAGTAHAQRRRGAEAHPAHWISLRHAALVTAALPAASVGCHCCWRSGTVGARVPLSAPRKDGAWLRSGHPIPLAGRAGLLAGTVRQQLCDVHAGPLQTWLHLPAGF